jgi:hypothetical protein
MVLAGGVVRAPASSEQTLLSSLEAWCGFIVRQTPRGQARVPVLVEQLHARLDAEGRTRAGVFDGDCQLALAVHGRTSRRRGRRDLGSIGTACNTWKMMEPAHVTLSGDLSGDYVIEDRRPDGRVVLRPGLSVKGMLSRNGERELTPKEFEHNFGELPTDGEG